MMIWVFAGTFLLQLLITQVGGEAFRTAPLDLIMWLKVIATAGSVVLLGETVKFFRRSREKTGSRNV